MTDVTKESLRRTPLYGVHKARGARIVPFAGWEMPVQYAGILEESRAVRTNVGLFDISHMGRTRISGANALTLLQWVTSNDVAALGKGQAQYSLLTNPQGGVIDDIIVYRTTDSSFLVVINASNTEKDLAHLRKEAARWGDSVTIEDITLETAMIAVQGPAAPALVASLATNPDADLLGLTRFSYATGSIGGASATFCRTGYTGEDGFEIILPAAAAETVWSLLEQGGAANCGLGARDALRIEAGYPLYGHEIDDVTTPVEAALMWVVKPEKGDFIGREALLEKKRNGAGKKLVGLLLNERIVPRQGYELFVGEEKVGTVTSGVFSPTRGCGLGMGYVQEPYYKPGSPVEVAIRANRYPLHIVPKKSLLTDK